MHTVVFAYGAAEPEELTGNALAVPGMGITLIVVSVG